MAPLCRPHGALEEQPDHEVVPGRGPIQRPQHLPHGQTDPAALGVPADGGRLSGQSQTAEEEKSRVESPERERERERVFWIIQRCRQSMKRDLRESVV